MEVYVTMGFMAKETSQTTANEDGKYDGNIGKPQ
jgi:hypothetical protein